MSPPLLSVRGVTAYYGHVKALKGVDIDVNDGEIVALIGANGAGKSTLMMTVCGNPRAREGQIVFAGRDITRMPTHEIAHLKLAHAPDFELYPVGFDPMKKGFLDIYLPVEG